MKTILHVCCSPRGQAAESYRLSQAIIGFLLRREPGATVVERVIGNGTIAHVDAAYAISQASAADVSREGSMALSEELIRELEAADFRGHRNADAQSDRPLGAEGLDRSCRAGAANLHDRPGRKGRHATRPPRL